MTNWGAILANHRLLHDEIRAMLTSGQMSTEEAVRLSLAAHSALLSEVSELKDAVEQVQKTQEEQMAYRPLTWYWQHNRKVLLGWLLAVFLVYTLIFSPWYVQEFRQALLQFFGLPADLGVIPPMPTPMP